MWVSKLRQRIGQLVERGGEWTDRWRASRSLVGRPSPWRSHYEVQRELGSNANSLARTAASDRKSDAHSCRLLKSRFPSPGNKLWWAMLFPSFFPSPSKPSEALSSSSPFPLAREGEEGPSVFLRPKEGRENLPEALRMDMTNTGCGDSNFEVCDEACRWEVVASCDSESDNVCCWIGSVAKWDLLECGKGKLSGVESRGSHVAADRRKREGRNGGRSYF